MVSVVVYVAVMVGQPFSTLPSSHQFADVQELFLLLVQLFVFDLQHYFETLQLLLQIQSVRVLLRGTKRSVMMRGY